VNPVLLGLLFYLLAVLFIGLLAYRQNRTHSDYILADRKLGSWAIALSERASGESAWLLLGLPGAALVLGFLEIWTVLGCLSGIILSWLFIAKPLRDLSGRYRSLTLPDLIASHFGDDNNLLRITASVIITFFFTFYVAAQFNGAGKVLNVSFGLNQFTGMVIGAGIIVLYTLLGGFFAVVWTDMLQAVIMFATLVILPIAGLIEIQQSSAFELQPIPETIFSLTGGKSGFWAFLAILGGLSWGFGYSGQPHLLARYMAIKNSDGIRKSRIIAYTWAIPAFFGAFSLGIIGLKLYGSGFFSDPEQLMPYMATALMPGWIAGILISGAIAAMMSSADSQLIVTTATLTEDFYHKIGKHNELTPEKLLLFSRFAALMAGLLAFLLAWHSSELVFSMVSYAWSGLGASFGPVLILMIYWKRISAAGALAGMLTGALTTIIWKSIPLLQNAVTERFSSFVAAFAMAMIISLLMPDTVSNSQKSKNKNKN
jgi:sodium/proline symporter